MPTKTVFPIRDEVGKEIGQVRFGLGVVVDRERVLDAHVAAGIERVPKAARDEVRAGGVAGCLAGLCQSRPAGPPAALAADATQVARGGGPSDPRGPARVDRRRRAVVSGADVGASGRSTGPRLGADRETAPPCRSARVRRSGVPSRSTFSRAEGCG